MTRLRLGIFGRNTMEVMLPLEEDVLSPCLITGDANLDYLVKVGSVGFLHCKVAVLSF